MPAPYRAHFDKEYIYDTELKFCTRIFEVLLASKLNFETKKTYNGSNKKGCTITLNCSEKKCRHKYRANFDKEGDATIIEFNKCIPSCQNCLVEVSNCIACHKQFESKQAYLIHIGMGHQ